MMIRFLLLQFYLDMEFVMLFASQGRFLSRNLQQVAKNIIARAIEAVSATGIDPYRLVKFTVHNKITLFIIVTHKLNLFPFWGAFYSTLPEDEWFAEVANIAVKMLTGKASFENEGHEEMSPTA